MSSDVLAHYDQATQRAAREIIKNYSTSFSLAVNLLKRQTRIDIQNLYAVVRVADEIVDGTASDAGLNRDTIGKALDEYEEKVLAAHSQRFHSDPILHAFANSARRCGFQQEHLRAFFASMRRDLEVSHHDHASFDTYVYGSAEVIGLLCLSAFLVDHPVTAVELEKLEHGARSLGAAFQKINFLRDLGDDASRLGRSYIPNLEGRTPENSDKDTMVAEIRNDLEDARQVIPLLPFSARAGVLTATEFFTTLTDKIDRMNVTELMSTRVSVPRSTKAIILTKAASAAARMSSPARTAQR